MGRCTEESKSKGKDKGEGNVNSDGGLNGDEGEEGEDIGAISFCMPEWPLPPPPHSLLLPYRPGDKQQQMYNDVTV